VLSVMSVSYFISKRIRFRGAGSFASTVIAISTISVAIGTMALIVAFSVLQGFRNQITAKIFGFGGHINIRNFSSESYYDENPVSLNSEVYINAKKLNGVTHIQQYSLKPALIKTEKEVQGIVIKGVGSDFNVQAFGSQMLRGRLPEFSDTSGVLEIVVSQKLASMVDLDTSSVATIFFIQEPPKIRKLKVVGIYQTGLEEFDNTTVLGDIRLLREVNEWEDSLAGGFEVFIDDFDRIDVINENIYNTIDYNMGTQKITDAQVQIFEWLGMIGRNVEVLLFLITLVACVNMVSTLLIMQLERSNMIGILKTLGAENRQVRNIFWYLGARIVGQGLLWGNILGFLVCFIQWKFRFIPLNSESYYMDFVPIDWNIWYYLTINVLVASCTLLAIFLPLMHLKRISPLKAIRFD